MLLRTLKRGSKGLRIMGNDFDRINDAVEDARLSFDHFIDQILDFCHDSYGAPRALEADDTKDLIRMIKELAP